MNFLFSTNPLHFDQLQRVIQEQSPLPIALAHVRGDWGAIVATKTPYFGLNPVQNEDETLIVLGDPLVELSTIDAATDTSRTEALLRKWDKDGQIFPEHAASLVRINFHQKTCCVVTDCCAAIPIFIGTADQSTVMSNSPDLVEMIIQSGPDLVAFRERLAAWQNTFPHTLYKGVTQTYPGAVTTVSARGTDITRWWTPPVIEADINPDLAREELRAIARDQMHRMVAQLGPKGALTMSAGADSRFAALYASSGNPSDMTAICQTIAPDLESETARQVAVALGMNFIRATRPVDHYPRFMRSRPFYVGSHVAWDHGHFAMGALGDIGEARFLLGGYWADSLFDDADMWNTSRARFQTKTPVSGNSRLFAVNAAFSFLSEHCRDEIGTRWANARVALGLGPEHSDRLAGIFPATRSLAAGHVAVSRYFYPDYQLFMNRRAIDLAFRLSAAFKKDYGKSFLLATQDERLAHIPVNPGQSRAVKSLVSQIRADIPPALWPGWVQHHGSWKNIEAKDTRRFYRAARSLRLPLAEALDLPAEAIPFQRNRAAAGRILQLGQVLGL